MAIGEKYQEMMFHGLELSDNAGLEKLHYAWNCNIQSLNAKGIATKQHALWKSV